MVVKTIGSVVQKIEAVYLSIVLVLMEITCGRKSSGDEKQLIDLEWPNEDTPLWRKVD